MLTTTCVAPVNIAVIKYWGKRDEDQILPLNSSLSLTLDHSQLRAKTTVATSRDFTSDCMWLNGKIQDIEAPRIQNVLREIRRRARKRKYDDDTKKRSINWKVHICSENNFPTAAGLASSAAGFACLVYSLTKLYEIDGDISEIARQGSGSACRSVYGGFVEWEMGRLPDGTDSIAKQIVTEDYWPELHVLILVVSSKKKAVGSTAGMQTSVKTSKLLDYRAQNTVHSRLVEIKKAIKEQNFHTFAELTMKDSNEMHACCLDTYPPISYMNDTSREIQRLVHYINDKHEQSVVAYTFDAGPNACLYLLEENIPMVMNLVKHCYEPEQKNGEPFIRGLPYNSENVGDELKRGIPFETNPGALQYIIHTKVGSGPKELKDPAESLLTENGMPLHLHTS